MELTVDPNIKQVENIKRKWNLQIKIQTKPHFSSEFSWQHKALRLKSYTSSENGLGSQNVIPNISAILCNKFYDDRDIGVKGVVSSINEQWLVIN